MKAGAYCSTIANTSDTHIQCIHYTDSRKLNQTHFSAKKYNRQNKIIEKAPPSVYPEKVDGEIHRISSVFSNKGRRLKPHAPVAQKVAYEVVFRRLQGEGVEFFKIGPH